MQFFLFRTTALEEKNADYIIDNQRFMKVIPPRFERGTHALEGRCSIQLSYGTILNCECKGTIIYEYTKRNMNFFMKK